MKRFLIVALTAWAVMGAECVPQDISVPYESVTPPVTIDLATQVRNFEDSINNGSDDHNKAVLAALCATESGRNCTPPSLPNSIPRSITDPSTGAELVVTDWLNQLPALDDLKDISQAVSFDVGEQLDVSTPDQIKSVTIDSIVVQFDDNSLTYPMPPMKVYVGSGIDNAALEDASLLIDDGRVTFFGELAEIPAADIEPHAMALDDAGRAVMSDALMQMDVALAVRSVVNFPPAGSDPIPKPDGEGTLRATIKATFVISTEVNSLF